MDYFWKNKGWENADPHLKKLASMPFQRPFPSLPKEEGLYIIRGPRQVGKSSWLKTILSHYAKRHDCFYLSCENIPDHKELAEILKSVRHCHVVLLDEVNFVEGWDRAIKHEIDQGHTHILVITGSHSYDLRRGADRMPGRFGAGNELHLLPMDFEEFEASRMQAGWASKDRVSEIEAYFRVGGFPAAILEGGQSGKKPVKAMQTYLRWLLGDVVRLGKDEIFLKEVLIQVSKTLQTPMSLQTLGKKTSIGSHNTVQEYISVLESCFALRTLFAIDLDSGSFRFRKDKKFYFTDPLIYWIALDIAGDAEPKNAFEKLSEMVANEALTRKYKRVGYFHSKKGEIDFVRGKKWALEVKWAPSPSNLSAAYKDLPFGEKIVWTHGNFLKEFPQEQA